MYTNLNSDKPLSAQPPSLKVQLFHHQLTIIYAMMQIESTGEISEIKDGDVTTSKVTTKFGILCDRVGAGKSNMILGFVDYVKNMIPQVMTKTKGCKYFSIVDTTAPTVNVIRTSLVIVPHSIANQWVGFLANTNLKYLIINKSKDVHDVVSSITKKPSRFARRPVSVVSDDDSEDVSFDDSSEDSDNSDSEEESVAKARFVNGRRGYATKAVPRKPTKPVRPTRRQPTRVISTVPASSLDKLASLISALPSLFQSTVASSNAAVNSAPTEPASVINNNTTNSNNSPITTAPITPKIMFKSAEEFLTQYDVVLLNTNRYDVFNSIFSDVTWARVIIDEADSIKMHRNLKPKYNFMWFVTATPRGLYNTSNHIVHSYVQSLRDFSSLDIMTFCVNNDAKYITESYELPKLKQYTITSRVNNIVKQLGEFLPNSIIGLINAGNINEAAKQLNCNLNSDGNICDALKSLHVTNLAKEVKELKRLETNLDDPANQDVAGTKANITKQKNKITSLETKIQAIEEKIASIKSESCCICYDNINAPTIVKCCNNLFCFSCLIESLKYRQFCPMCRRPMDHKSYYVVDENKSASSTTTTVNQNLIELSKKDILKELLVQLYKSNPKTRVLLFSDYAKTFENVASVFDDLKLTRNTISGTPDRINKMITGFENYLINVLMLDTHHYGSGLNLQMADVIILYHRMDASVETQVIGRAHRLGRTTSLKVFFISSDNEGKDKPVALATNLLNTDELLAAIVD